MYIYFVPDTKTNFMSKDTTTLNFRGNGKLLLSGEYFILDGAVGLAIPVRLGQRMSVMQGEEAGLHWQSLTLRGETWFEARFELPTLEISSTTHDESAKILQKIMRYARSKDLDFMRGETQLKITTRLEFPQDWGMGSSSTLIYMMAKWAKLNPFELLEKTFGGSGYDLICAEVNTPIFFQKQEEQRVYQPTEFGKHPETGEPLPFLKNLYLVHLNKKQNSREGIERYREWDDEDNKAQRAQQISMLTDRFQRATSLPELNAIIREHEDIVSSSLKLKMAKDLYFNDFWGEVKSLGAWGGDFVLVTSQRTPQSTKTYFREKGFKVCLKYLDVVI